MHSKQRSEWLRLLGIEIIDNNIDQVRDGLILIVIEQPLDHQVKVQALNITLYMLKQLLLLQVPQFGQQAQQTLQANLQLFVIAFLHGLLHPSCQDHMDLQGQDER